MVGCLGWDGVTLASARRQVGQQADRVPEEGRRPPYPLTLRLATALQLRREGIFWQQRDAPRLYAADALFGIGAVLSDVQNMRVTKACARLGDAITNLWQLPWENERKEVHWRPAVNGVPGAGGHDISQAGPCSCGWAGQVLWHFVAACCGQCIWMSSPMPHSRRRSHLSQRIA